MGTWRIKGLALAAILAASGASRVASASGWSLTILNPPGAINSEVNAVWGDRQAGAVDGHAGMWSGTAGSFVDLNPAAGGSSVLYAVSDTHQGGSYSPPGASWQHAAIWSGTPESLVDLDPQTLHRGSFITALQGEVAGGIAFHGYEQHATIWTGPQWTEMDLTPGAPSVLYDMDGGRQVGGANGHAAIWSGTVASLVDLHPAGAASSVLMGIHGSEQGGSVRYAHEMATVWHDTPESAVNLEPAGADWSRVNDVHGGYQVGYVEFNLRSHASLWSGTAESFEDLSIYTNGFVRTWASGVYADANGITVVGGGVDSAGASSALMWYKPVPEPASIAALGFGLLGLLRRRRDRRPR